MDIVDRIDSCRSFAEGHCPHQALMERLYLIYQIFETKQFLRAKAFCRQCGGYASQMSLVARPPDRLGCGHA
jgi:ribosomal protein S27AE